MTDVSGRHTSDRASLPSWVPVGDDESEFHDGRQAPRPVSATPGAPTLSTDGFGVLAGSATRGRWRRPRPASRGFGGRDHGDYDQLMARVRQPIRGDFRIAMLSLKGGVGKTTTTVGLGATFATLRGDRVIAVDANPDLGTLCQRVPTQTASTVRDLIADPAIHRYSDVRLHTSQAASRLEVLASERDPAQAELFGEHDYRRAMDILRRYYNIILTDCGTGLSHSVMRGVLDVAHAIILVTSPALDGARSADATLEWLRAHGYGHLVSRAVVAISSSRPGSSRIDVDQLSRHFLTKCRAVQEIPFDEHLAEGAVVDLDRVGRPTRRAFVELSATMADELGYVAQR